MQLITEHVCVEIKFHAEQWKHMFAFAALVQSAEASGAGGAQKERSCQCCFSWNHFQLSNGENLSLGALLLHMCARRTHFSQCILLFVIRLHAERNSLEFRSAFSLHFSPMIIFSDFFCDELAALPFFFCMENEMQCMHLFATRSLWAKRDSMNGERGWRRRACLKQRRRSFRRWALAADCRVAEHLNRCRSVVEPLQRAEAPSTWQCLSMHSLALNASSAVISSLVRYF